MENQSAGVREQGQRVLGWLHYNLRLSRLSSWTAELTTISFDTRTGLVQREEDALGTVGLELQTRRKEDRPHWER